jgi:hypothetical protein
MADKTLAVMAVKCFDGADVIGVNNPCGERV